MIILHFKEIKSLDIKKCKRFFSQYGGIKVKIEQQFDDIQKNAIIKIIDERQPSNNIVINIRSLDNENKNEFLNDYSKINNIKKSALDKIKYQGEIEYYDNFRLLMTYVFVLYIIKIKNIKAYSVKTKWDENNIGSKYVKIDKLDIIGEINHISEKVKQQLSVRPRKCVEVALKIALRFIPFVNSRYIYMYTGINSENRSLKKVLHRILSQIGFLCLNRIEKLITIGGSILLFILIIVLLIVII